MLDNIEVNTSTYRADYIKHNLAVLPPDRPRELLQRLDEADIFIPRKRRDRQLTVDESCIERFKKRRLASVYQVDYCNLLEALDAEEGADVTVPAPGLHDAMLSSLKKVYSERKGQVLPPPNSSRVLFGFMRPKAFYTGLSEYQDTVGRHGLTLLLKDLGNMPP